MAKICAEQYCLKASACSPPHVFEPDRGHSFEPLVLRIDFYANRL